MKKNLILLAMMVIALMGLLLPANAEYKSYIFKEDFDNTTLDNQTWVNLSDPFPYQIRDSKLILKFYQDPNNKYAISNNYTIDESIMKLHGEFKVYFDIAKIQDDFSYSHFMVIVDFHNNTDETFGANAHNIKFMFDFYWQSFSASIWIGGKSSYKTYTGELAKEIYGNITSFHVVFNAYRHLNETNKTDYWTVTAQILDENNMPIIANMDRIHPVENKLHVTIQNWKSSTQVPTDGEAQLDYIYIGEEKTPAPEPQPLYPFFLLFAMIFIFVGGLGILADTVEKYGDMWFYLELIGFALLGISFVLMPFQIFGIPAFVYGISLFPFVIEEFYANRTNPIF